MDSEWHLLRKQRWRTVGRAIGAVADDPGAFGAIFDRHAPRCSGILVRRAGR